MSESGVPSPPAGWYPDPERPGQTRWWNGAAWDRSLPGPQPVTGTIGRGFRGLSAALLLLLSFVGACAVASLAVEVYGVQTVADDIDHGLVGSATTYDDLNAAIGVATLVLMIGAGVVWCVWQYRLARAAGPASLRRSPGMHAGSWFIPVVCLWFPLQNMRDLWRAGVPKRGTALLGWWWAAWILSAITGRVAVAVDVHDADSFRSFNVIGMVDSVVGVVSAMLALCIVATLSHAAVAPGVIFGPSGTAGTSQGPVSAR